MNKVDKVVILGGGSAGWMTAATLVHNFPEKEIVLVESPDTPRIGVGESTLAGLPSWLKSIDIDYKDFMQYTDASFKMTGKDIDLWKMYNLFTGANKSTYIDQFVDRAVNAQNLMQEVIAHKKGEKQSWFLG